jgi:LmbE family N-acetylglucosaminyl deacetylase
MIHTLLELTTSRAPRVLLLGAHCDDIEIGCGGLLQVLSEARRDIEWRWTVMSSTDERAAETRHCARLLLPEGASVEFDVQSFRESYFPYVGAAIKDHIESIKQQFTPDLILTHFEGDRHQDHRIVSELTKNAFRDHLILEYEIVKYDADLLHPSVFVPLTPRHVEQKAAALLEAFASQRDKQWFTGDTFRAILRLRGIEANAPSGFAEAFHCRKLVVTV